MGHDAGVNLMPVPKATITDADVATALGRAVQIIDPLLDVLWGTDPLGLKERTRHPGAADGALDKAQAAAAWVLNAVDVPGTRAWDEKDLDARDEFRIQLHVFVGQRVDGGIEQILRQRQLAGE